MSKKFVAVAMTRDEAKIWANGVDAHLQPHKVHARVEGLQHNVHTAETHSGHNKEHQQPEFYERIASHLKDANEILLISSGKGKASSAAHFKDYLEHKHADMAKKIVDVLDADFQHETEGQILARARHWLDAHKKMV